MLISKKIIEDVIDSMMESAKGGVENVDFADSNQDIIGPYIELPRDFLTEDDKTKLIDKANKNGYGLNFKNSSVFNGDAKYYSWQIELVFLK